MVHECIELYSYCKKKKEKEIRNEKKKRRKKRRGCDGRGRERVVCVLTLLKSLIVNGVRQVEERLSKREY